MAWWRKWTGGVNRAAAPALARASPGASDRKASPLAEAHPDFLAGLWLRLSCTKVLKPLNDLLEGGFVPMCQPTSKTAPLPAPEGPPPDQKGLAMPLNWLPGNSLEQQPVNNLRG